VILATRKGNAEFLGAINLSNGGDVEDGGGNVLPGTAFSSMSGLVKGKLALGDDGDQSLTFALSRTDSDLDDTSVAQTGGDVSGDRQFRGVRDAGANAADGDVG
jgi:hemoglobin/transferrin/lactoferrin receptor protein